MIESGDKVQVVRLTGSGYWEERLDLPFPEIENLLVGQEGRATRIGWATVKVEMENEEIRKRLKSPFFISWEIRKVPLLVERIKSYSEEGAKGDRDKEGR